MCGASGSLRGMCECQLYLASNSPRRRELLAQIGVSYCVLQVAVDESIQPGEAAVALVQRLALAKARAGRAALPEDETKPVLGADTVVVCAGQILGKPVDRAAGLAMLAQLSGRSHEVYSAVALVSAQRERVAQHCSHVRFRDISPAEAAAYWASGEPQDKAGAYAIQGVGALFIAELSGSYSGVMGLPLFETAQLLNEFAIKILETGRV